jgi:hypothetical protein
MSIYFKKYNEYLNILAQTQFKFIVESFTAYIYLSALSFLSLFPSFIL